MNNNPLILIQHYDDGLTDNVRLFKSRLKKKDYSLVETSQGLIESKLISGSPLDTTQIFNYTSYASVLLFDTLKLGVEIYGFSQLGYQVNKFIQGLSTKTNKDILLIHEVERNDNFPLHICFVIKTSLNDIHRLEALNKIKKNTELIIENLNRYKDYEIISLEYNSDTLKNWDLKNFKVFRRNHGQSMLSSIRTGKAFGHAPKSSFPDKPWASLWEMVNEPVSKEVYDIALNIKTGYYQRLYSVNEMKEALTMSPLSLCVCIFENFKNPLNGKILLPQKNDNKIGGHCVSVVGYKEESKEFIIDNSVWGKEWGENGIGYLPFEYIDHYLIEVWGSSVEVNRNFLNKKTTIKNIFRPKFLRSFFQDRKNQKVLEAGEFLDKRNACLKYEIKSVAPINFSQGYLFTINIIDANNPNKYDGWMHFSYNHDDKIIEIEELFIQEPHRGYGLGSNLLRLVKSYAKRLEVEKIVGWTSSIDSYNELQENRLKNFFIKNQYTCTDDTTRYLGSSFKFENDQ